MKLFKKLISLTLVLVMILAMSMSNRVDVSASMINLEEVERYLVLDNYSNEKLSSVPLEDIILNLYDSNGQKVEIEKNAKKIWLYSGNDKDGVEEYKLFNVDQKDQVLDLSQYKNTIQFDLQMIVGNGEQLDKENKRYIIHVFLSENFDDELDFEVYAQYKDKGNTKVEISKKDYSTASQDIPYIGNVPIKMFGYYTNKTIECDKALFNLISKKSKHPDIKLEVYNYNEYLENKKNNSETNKPITNKILNQDMSLMTSGYEFKNDTNLFVLVYYYKGIQVDLNVVGIVVAGGYIHYEANIYKDENGSLQNAANNINESEDTTRKTLYNIELKEGYSIDENYNFAFKVKGTGKIDKDFSEVALKAVEGNYNSIDEVGNVQDIKAQLFSEKGYSRNYSKSVDFTIFFPNGTFADGNVKHISVKVVPYKDTMQDYTDSPIIGAKDPWFRVNGAIQNENTLDTYTVENGKSINMDTLYGYGYQTIFINDKNVDLSKLKPTFWLGSSERVETYIGTKQLSGKNVQDFSNGSKIYSTIIDDHTKNYNVTFVKKESGPKLYVNGPSSRAIFLDEYFEYKHDILIANVGDKPLTGLKVKLDATNVKLDDYWTVGGNNNDTLDAFTTTTVNSKYGQLNNLAKIRLLPDGDGEIKGTLTISADGQEDQVIKLSGRASNPTIITDKLDNAVKYVPYSYLVSTDNMNDWNSVKFSLESGTLPEGLTLNENTGEIYGVAQESGTYSFRVKATYGRSDYFEPSYQDLTLTVDDNTNKNVFEASDEGYTIKKAIGEEVGTYNYVLDELEDTVFTSYGENDNFVDVWINGQKLDVSEYERESGSTKLTIKKQTLEKRVRPGNNTIAQEFREEKGDKNSKLRRTAQNFVVRDKTQLNKVINLISKIPSKVTLNNKQQIVDARKAYNQLSATDKKDVTNYDRLVQAEKAIAQLEKIQADMNEAKKVDKLIDLIPTKVTLKDRQSVENARNAYNNLSSSQKEYVTKYQKLLSAEETILSLEKEDETIHNVTFVGILKDKKGNSLSDKIVELHSTVKSGKTDENGSFLFNSVDFGKHTIYVKDAKGNMIAQKEFEIREGKEMSIVNDIITVDNHSIFTLNIVLDGNKLIFNKIEKGNKAPTIEVKYGEELVNGISITNHSKNRKNGLKTGDETKVLMWVSLSIMSLIVILMILRFYLTKKKII